MSKIGSKRSLEQASGAPSPKQGRVVDDLTGPIQPVGWDKDTLILRESVVSEYPEYCARARDVIRLYFVCWKVSRLCFAVTSGEEVDEVLGQKRSVPSAPLAPELLHRGETLVAEEVGDGDDDGDEEEEDGEKVEGGEEEEEEEEEEDDSEDEEREDMGDGSEGFVPLFVHHFFGKRERVVGYRDANIRVLWNSRSLRCFLDVSSSDQLEDELADSVVERMRVGLSRPLCGSKEELVEEDDVEFWKMGEVFGEYEREGQGYEMRRWRLDDKGVVLHRRVEALCEYMIETAECADLSDTSRWEAVALIEKESRKLVGYASLYSYTNLFRPEQPLSLCVAQMVVLPSFLGQGHGSALFDAIQTHGKDHRKAFVITAESPSDMFLRSRRQYLLRSTLAHFAPSASSLDALCAEIIDSELALLDSEDQEEQEPVPLPTLTSILDSLTTSLLTSRHVAREILEILLLKHCWKPPPSKKSDPTKPYRLLVKRRLSPQVAEHSAEKPRMRSLDALYFQTLLDQAYTLSKLGHITEEEIQVIEDVAEQTLEDAKICVQEFTVQDEEKSQQDAIEEILGQLQNNSEGIDIEALKKNPHALFKK